MWCDTLLLIFSGAYMIWLYPRAIRRKNKSGQQPDQN